MFSLFLTILLSIATFVNADTIDVKYPSNNTIVTRNDNITIRAGRNGMAYLVWPNVTIAQADNGTQTLLFREPIKHFGDNNYTLANFTDGRYVIVLDYNLTHALSQESYHHVTWNFFQVQGGPSVQNGTLVSNSKRSFAVVVTLVIGWAIVLSACVYMTL
jgi:hypothetical protein